MNLMQLFKEFIRNYASLQLHDDDLGRKKFTEREVGYFTRAGEVMGYYTFQEEKLEIKGKNRYCDLLWATYNPKQEEYTFDLHLEHENTLTTQETLETKLSDVINLIAITKVKTKDYSDIIDVAKGKLKGYPDIRNILLILRNTHKKVKLMYGLEISKKGKKIGINQCEGLLKQTENGFFYGILKAEIESDQWEKIITE